METLTNNQEGEQEYRTDICAPNCPLVGQKYPHSPHIPLYPTDWCKEPELPDQETPVVDEEKLPF